MFRTDLDSNPKWKISDYDGMNGFSTRSFCFDIYLEQLTRNTGNCKNNCGHKHGSVLFGLFSIMKHRSAIQNNRKVLLLLLLIWAVFSV